MEQQELKHKAGRALDGVLCSQEDTRTPISEGTDGGGPSCEGRACLGRCVAVFCHLAQRQLWAEPGRATLAPSPGAHFAGQLTQGKHSWAANGTSAPQGDPVRTMSLGTTPRRWTVLSVCAPKGTDYDDAGPGDRALGTVVIRGAESVPGGAHAAAMAGCRNKSEVTIWERVVPGAAPRTKRGAGGPCRAGDAPLN